MIVGHTLTYLSPLGFSCNAYASGLNRASLALLSIRAMLDIIEALRLDPVGWNHDCILCFSPIKSLHVKITKPCTDRQLTASFRTNPAEDETLTIKCPDAPDGTGQVFEVKKSTLIRSPAFARFCQSDSFLPGCHMHLTFMTDPAICFKIAIYYLEEGPDRYNKTRLSVFLRAHFKTVDRFILLGRLYFLAMRMELPGLFDMCYTIMEDYEHDMTAGYCITMASLIFARDASYDKRMKEWCMRYIRNYLLHLSQIREWRDLVPQLDPELQHHWAKLVENNKRVIAAIEEERIGTAKDETMSLSSIEDQRRISTRVEDHLQDLKVEEVIHEVLGEQADSDQEWEDVESLLREKIPDKTAQDTEVAPSRLSDDKANSVLGLSPSKKKIDAIVEWHNSRLKPKEKAKEDAPWMENCGPVANPEVAKARAVMGINTINGKLTGHKKRRFSRKVYSLLHS